LFVMVLVLAFGLTLPLTGFSQAFSINWYKVAGGGGVSTGGVYSVSGTIGQHDASSALLGGTETVTGGFWSLIAVNTPGAPRLSISLTPTNTAVVSWPAPSTGWTLQQNGNLSFPAGWTTVTNPVSTVGGRKQVIISPPAGNRFFRLRTP
jgi:hypothetical protein